MDVGLALRNCSKGQLKYDKYWVEEGRVKEVLDEISQYSTKVSVKISPSIFPLIVAENEAPSRNIIKLDSPRQLHVKENEIFKATQSATDVCFYELQSEMELPIINYKEEIIKYKTEIFESKKLKYYNHTLEVEEQIEQEYLLSKRRIELDARRRAGELQKLEESMIKEAQQLEKIQKEQYQSHVKKLSAKLLEAEMKQKQAEEEMRKKTQEQEELKSQLSAYLHDSSKMVSKSLEKLNSCEHKGYLAISYDNRMKQMTDLLNYIKDITVQGERRELTLDDILNANLQAQKAFEILQEISADIEAAKVKAIKAQEALYAASTRRENIVATEPLDNSQSKDSAKNIKQESQLETKASTNKELKKDNKSIISLIMALDAVDHYQAILDNFKRSDKHVQSMRNDPKIKKYRFELQKAINVPINSLSSNSGSQIKVKVNTLLSLLNGTVPLTRGQNLNPDSVVFSFCCNLIAKQFVEQGDTQVSSQHSTAFPIAFAALGVWLKQPEAGKLLLGHFYDKCPYLVPYYPPREAGQTDEEYFRSLGYRVDADGNIEAKYKFLNRISGYVRLYASIVQSPLPPNVKSPHPHGLEWGWRWLSRMLNLDPRPDITATVLYDFLDVAGYALQKTYGKQFNKMLHILCKDYFQRIKQVTPGGSGGPLERLEIFLQQSAKKGRISPPEGILDANFWIR